MFIIQFTTQENRSGFLYGGCVKSLTLFKCPAKAGIGSVIPVISLSLCFYDAEVVLLD
jgi:hypothetical protein